MAVAAVLANLSRILAWWREVDWRACAAYSITGIPAAALGARTLLALAVARSRHFDRAVSDCDGAGAALARAASTETLAVAARARRRGHRLSHRHRGFDRAAERAAVPVLRPHPRCVSRHRSGEFARPLFQQIRDVSALRRADGRHRAEGPDRRLLADVRRLHRQTLCVAAGAGGVPAGDGCASCSRPACPCCGTRRLHKIRLRPSSGSEPIGAHGRRRNAGHIEPRSGHVMDDGAARSRI